MALVKPEIKDLILNHLIETYEIGDWDLIPDTQVIHGVTGKTLIGIIQQFGRMGLIVCEDHPTLGGDMFLGVTVNVEAHDFYQSGGFYGHFELFKKTVERLLWQVEKLEQVSGEHKQEVVDIGKKISEYVALIANLGSIGDSAIDGLGS